MAYLFAADRSDRQDIYAHIHIITYAIHACMHACMHTHIHVQHK